MEEREQGCRGEEIDRGSEELRGLGRALALGEASRCVFGRAMPSDSLNGTVGQRTSPPESEQLCATRNTHAHLCLPAALG